MSLQPGQSIAFRTTTQQVSGEAADADELPTGVMVRQGDATGETVLVEDVPGIGKYKVSATVPSDWPIGDVVEIELSAIVDGIAATVVVFREVLGVPTNVTLGAVTASRQPGQRTSSPIALEMFQASIKAFPIVVLDTTGAVVDLSAKTLRFIVQSGAKPNVGKFKVEQGAGIVVSGASNEVAMVTVSAAQSANVSQDWLWRLFDTVGSEVLAHGPFSIFESRADVP